MANDERRLARMITSMALAVAVLSAIAAPLGMLHAGYGRHVERIELLVSAGGSFAVAGRTLADDRVQTIVAALRDAVLSMRSEMARHKQPGGPIDAKLMRGGLVDCEFLVHYLQLKGETAGGAPLAEAQPLALAPDLAVALGGLVAAGLLPADLAQPHALMSRMLVAGRLLAPDGREPPPSAARALARACGFESYAALLEGFGAARLSVAQAWKQILGTDILEGEQETD